MRAIVTGGAGFIGSHVAEALLARGDDVLVLDDLSRGKRENVPEGAQLEVADIREPLDDWFVGAEACLHLAAQADVRVSVDRPDFDAEVNVLGTIRVLEAARLNGTQVVFSSTGGAIYGECESPAPEEAERRPLSPYGISKLAGEEYLAGYNRLYGTKHVALRYGNVYGPRQDPHGEAGVVAIFLSRLASGETARIFGDGRATRDYVYAGDVARATAGGGRPGRGRLQRRHRDRDLRQRDLRALPPRGGLGGRGGVRGSAARRAPAQRPRPIARGAGARLAARDLARGRAPPHLGSVQLTAFFREDRGAWRRNRRSARGARTSS